jgi:hypothetical protein
MVFPGDGVMSLKTAVSVCVLAAFATVSSGCRSGEPIDNETAMNLIKDRNTDPVKLTFSASPPQNASATVTDAYTQLIDAHVITCTTTVGMGKICQPGPAGDAVTQVGAAELSIVAGRWVPASITTISRPVGSSGATAEVRLTFELSPLYRDFENAFDAIQLYAGKSPIENKREGKMAHAVFQRYEDGWHLESLT